MNELYYLMWIKRSQILVEVWLPEPRTKSDNESGQPGKTQLHSKLFKKSLSGASAMATSSLEHLSRSSLPLVSDWVVLQPGPMPGSVAAYQNAHFGLQTGSLAWPWICPIPCSLDWHTLLFLDTDTGAALPASFRYCQTSGWPLLLEEPALSAHWPYDQDYR